jgi:hypothetical protein
MTANNTNGNRNLIFVGTCFCVFFILSIISLHLVSAHPPLPTEFYGTLTSYNSPATGTIKAYAGTISCGTFYASNTGYYGVLSCFGKDTDDSNATGGVESQVITFTYNGNPTTATGDNTFTSGSFKWVNITYPIVFCGDSFCDSLESCFACPSDCGECNATGNVSQNVTTNETGNGTTSPGTSGGGGGGKGGGGKGNGGGSGGAGGAAAVGQYTCFESWDCKNWSDCSMLGIRNRTCNDRNNCGTYNNKPKEVEECKYIGTCFDNLINCHNDKCEEGIDCGGPCEKKCPIIEQPLVNISIKLPVLEIPTHVCERHISLDNSALLWFLIIICLSIVIRIIYTKICVNRLRKSEKLAPLERAKKIRSAKRKAWLFTITLIFLMAVSVLYFYYFLLCPSDFAKYFWMLFVALILIPFVIHAVMKKLEYNESVHIYKNRELDDVHYQSLVKMIELENNILADEENAIANQLYGLSRKDEFKELMDKDTNLKEIYKNLVRLYTDYNEKKNPFNVEKNICEEIDALDSDELFKTELLKHQEMKHIFERLKKLYSQYGEKQELYNKLDELEQSVQKGKAEKKDVKKEEKK